MQTTTQVWLGFISPILSIIVTGVLSILVAKFGKASQESSIRQESNLIEIRTFTNSALGISLKVGAAALRRVADITKLTDDIKVAELAEAQSGAHEAAQQVVNAQQAATLVSKQ
jgi:hypothetical protein